MAEPVTARQNAIYDYILMFSTKRTDRRFVQKSGCEVS